MTPADCPHYDTCSAPICPMDSDWRQRNMLKDEQVCLYIRKASRGEDVPVSLEVVKAQIAAHRYIANDLAKTAARREREAHPTNSGICSGGCVGMANRPEVPCTPRKPGLHPTVEGGLSDCSEVAA